MKPIALDKLVQINAEALKRNAEMVSEKEMARHTDIVVFILRVPFNEILENLDLHEGLRMEPFLVANHLDGHRLAREMVKAFEHLAKRAFAHDLQDLVTILEMVALLDEVIATLVVIAIVAAGLGQTGGPLLCMVTDKVNLFVFCDFLLFIVRQTRVI